jgi:nucleotide-binding universal stress UspA family protein
MRILYATDGSPGALAAAQFLASLPLDTSCRLTILTVDSGEGKADGQETLAAARAALSHSTASLETEVRRGHPEQEILQMAEASPTDLIVVGWTGDSAIARFFVGSVTERVARHASLPVLVARPLQKDLRLMVLGIDGSPGAMHAAEWLLSFPLPVDCEIRLVTVLTPVEELTRTSRLLPLPLMSHEDAEAFAERQRRDAEAWLDERAASFASGGQRAVTEIRRADPAVGLLEVAEELGADLIVVGSQGHGAIERFMMGSVSEKLMRQAHCSVLLVK